MDGSDEGREDGDPYLYVSDWCKDLVYSTAERDHVTPTVDYSDVKERNLNSHVSVSGSWRLLICS